MNLQFWGELGLAVAFLIGVFSLTWWALDQLEDERARIAERAAVHEARHLRIVSRTGARR